MINSSFKIEILPLYSSLKCYIYWATQRMPWLNTEESTFLCTLALEHIARKVHDQNEHSTHVNFVNFTYLAQCFKDSI